MKYSLLFLLLPSLLSAQEFTFRQEYDTIPVEINGWQPYQPWMGGLSKSSPEFCDINSDNLYDLFVGDFLGHISYLKGDSTLAGYRLLFETSFFDSISVSGPPWGGSAAPCFGDLDSDGDLDLIVGDANSYTHYYCNIGNTQSPEYELITDNLVPQGPPWVSSPAMVDIDADGDLDLFGGWEQITFYQNVGTSQSYNFQLVTGNFANINISGGGAAISFIDIDADNDYDLFIGNEIGRIYYYRNDGDSVNYDFTYVTDNYNDIDVGGYASPEFADIDGDGDFDLFVGREQTSTATDPGDIFFYENVGTPEVAQWEFVTKNYISLDVGYLAQSATTDIDSDQDRDIFIQHIGDRLSYYENIGAIDSSSYHWITDNYQNIFVNDAFPEFGDLDDDGDPDLLMGEGAIPGPPGIYLYQNQGTPQSASFNLVSTNYIPGVFTQSSVINAIALADIDADGDLDLFTSDQDRHLYYFENIGSAANPEFVLISTNWQSIFQPSTPTMLLVPMFYDIDEDSDLDLFCGGNYGYSQFWFYRNEGTPQNAQMVLVTQTFLGESYQNFYGVDIFDIDQDGDGDFLLSTGKGGMLFFRNTTGDTSAVNPRIAQHPLHGIELSFGPNPANPVTWVTFSLSYPQKAELAVYNLLGQKVATLASGYQMPGSRTYFWNAINTSSGTYFIRLETEKTEAVQRVMVVR
jgi:hypothetical protein